MKGKKLFKKDRALFFVILYGFFSIPIHLLIIALTIVKMDAMDLPIIPSLHRKMKHNIHENNMEQTSVCLIPNAVELTAEPIPIPATTTIANAAEKINFSANGNDGQNASQDSSIAKALPNDLAVATVLNFVDENTGIPIRVPLVTTYFENDMLKPGMPIAFGQAIAQGGYGNIFEGSANNQSLIIKQVRVDKGEKGLRGIGREWDASVSLYNAVIEMLNKKNLPYDILLGISTIVPVIGTATDGSLIQRKVSGKNLKNIVVDETTPYEFGYPNCLLEAIERLCFFFFGLNIIHVSNSVHCDLKPENIMLENNPNEGHPVRIIDFGGLRTIGDTIGIHSSNGAPEYTEQTYAIRENKLKQEQLKKERDEIQKQISQSSSPEEIEQLKTEIQSMKEQYDALAKLIAFEESLRNNIAHPSYDIYSSATIFLTILFGRSGLRLANKLYCFHQKGPIKFRFLQMARDSSFNAAHYFQKALTELNQIMCDATGKSYPPPALDQFIQLISAMSSLDPNERPSAIDIVERLQGLALVLPEGSALWTPARRLAMGLCPIPRKESRTP
ncbi:MAG: hypothetical protein LBJ13_01585 [Puniceicoccales bacterium]|jgi:serine/threonine protein kinase|nr:hypothetical protein [Puniceicoccales bacterium]